MYLGLGDRGLCEGHAGQDLAHIQWAGFSELSPGRYQASHTQREGRVRILVRPVPVSDIRWQNLAMALGPPVSRQAMTPVRGSL